MQKVGMERVKYLIFILLFFSLTPIVYSALSREFKIFYSRDVTVDKGGNVYAIGYRGNRYYLSILKFNEDGKFQTSICEELYDVNRGGINQYIAGTGVDMGKNIILEEDGRKVYFRDKKSIEKLFSYLGVKPSVSNLLEKIIHPSVPMAINNKGLLYVIGQGLQDVIIEQRIEAGPRKGELVKVKFAEQRIGILNPGDGHPVKVFGKTGTGKGETLGLQDLDIDAKDNIYVADWRNGKVLKYDKNGNFLFEWGKLGRKEGGFFGLKWLAVDKKNNWVYTGEDSFATEWERGMHRVQKFTTDGKFLAAWGGKKPKGVTRLSNFLPFSLIPVMEWEYEFYSVEGLDVDDDGNVWILSTDPEKCAVRKYSPDGKELMKIGEGILSRNIEGLAVGPDGTVWVSDWYKKRIVKFDSKGKYLGEIK